MQPIFKGEDVMGHGQRYSGLSRVALVAGLVAVSASPAVAQTTGPVTDASASPADSRVEDIVVVARKRRESVQDAPVAITAFSADALDVKGISSLGDFVGSPTPFLQISPYAGSGALPIIGIRGLATDDPGQGGNESAVGIYLDGVYLGRAQGSLAELADVERIEVLRGPQGTLFGRNALGGAVNIISKEPTGQLGLEQTFEYGSYNQFRSLSHLNLPAFGGLKIKADLLYSRRDGWVKNRASDYADYSAYDRLGGRVAAHLDLSDRFAADYVFDIAVDKTTMGYQQRITANDQSPLPIEPDRVSISQSPQLLQPTKTTTHGHALTLMYQASDALTIKSISAYRDLDYNAFESYPNIFVYVPLGPDLALSGLALFQRDKQHQFSQELQATGETRSVLGKLNYAAGLYYFDEHVETTQTQGSTLYSFANGGTANPANAAILTPFIPFVVPASQSQIDTRSYAAYGQASVVPPILDDRLELTVGLRYTHDKKKGLQLQFQGAPSTAAFDLPSHSLDHNVTLAFSPVKDVHIYVRHATGYRASGVSLRDPAFVPFKPDSTDSLELGLKSEFWQHRARINLAGFATDFHDMRTSFSDPADPTTTRLFNAKRKTTVKGLEVEATLVPFDGVTLAAAYSHLEVHVPDQANPFDPSQVQAFTLSQAPRDSASLSADIKVANLRVGKLSLHGDGYWTSRVVSVPQLVTTGTGYSLYNARLTLSDIPLFGDHRLKAALWVKNLTDEKYRVFELAWVGTTSTSRVVQFGTPRTVGAETSFAF